MEWSLLQISSHSVAKVRYSDRYFKSRLTKSQKKCAAEGTKVRLNSAVWTCGLKTGDLRRDDNRLSAVVDGILSNWDSTETFGRRKFRGWGFGKAGNIAEGIGSAGRNKVMWSLILNEIFRENFRSFVEHVREAFTFRELRVFFPFIWTTIKHPNLDVQ
jgi:hypothetical protein